MVDSYEHHFTVRLPGNISMILVRRPVTTVPPDGKNCWVDDGDRNGYKNGQSPARFRNGEWDNGKGRALRFVPTHWTTLAENGIRGGSQSEEA